MENKKTKKFKDTLPVEGKIKAEPIKKKDFDKTLSALLKTPPPQKNNS
ncbi:MAG: hypothetical protein IPK91_15360 [Saprospiraceae bacterium]|nr:hypothetical protein [Saprospiraceae bacterium]